jgi:hypothetical protein
MPNRDDNAPLFNDLERFYKRVDLEARLICELEPGRFHCGPGCHECCVDGLSVFEIEAKNIAHYHRDLLVHRKPRPEGACAFLDESGRCGIYEHRPYVCRTQGLPLRWIEELRDSRSVEMRDVCPLNDKGVPLEALVPDACWTIGPYEEELGRMQITDSGKTCRRVLLRDLFIHQIR